MHHFLVCSYKIEEGIFSEDSPMDTKKALHTAARRYCLKRVPGLDPVYNEYPHRDRRWMRGDRSLYWKWFEARGTWVQMEVVGDLLTQIEEVTPEAFPSVE